jgi:Tol biopolymer transport system component
MSGYKLLAAPLIFALAILACASPLATQTVSSVPTIVAQTMQALGSPAPSSAPSDTPAPLVTPTAANLLPQSIYFLNKDAGGLMQVFRMEADGKTTRQITFEPAKVDAYDVSPKDGSLAYISNNQLFLVDATGAGRRTLVDGGPVNDNNRWTNAVGSPIWSPDGAMIAFSHNGLNFYTLGTGAVSQVLQNQIDNSAGFPMPRELYSPMSFSPDGSRLVVTISFFEGGTYGIYYLSNNALLRMKRADGGMVCCRVDWIPDGTGLYLSSPTLGMVESGLFFADASTGSVSTLLPGAASNDTYNFADAVRVGPDGKIYFFFNNLPTIPVSGHTPLFLVRSDSDGVTGRTQLLPEAFPAINEILWAPDASLAVLATVDPNAKPEIYQGGQAQIVYPDGRPSVTIAPFVQSMHWGP